MNTTEKLEKILRAAEVAALAADPGPDQDGGTCNMDQPTLLLPHVRRGEIEAASERAGVEVYRFQWMKRTAYWVQVTLGGQGSRRTKMAEAAAAAMTRELEELGCDTWRSMVYYAID